MRRPWIVPLLMVGALVGVTLIVTADDETGPPLDALVTAEGLSTRVPTGWLASDELPFEFSPGGDEHGFDRWTVARACPQDGCGARSLDEWLDLADLLPTFGNLRLQNGATVFNLEEEFLSDAQVSRARTEAGVQLVFVAAFADGAASYVACSVSVPIGGDEALTEAIVDVCRDTQPVD